jgi:uncharacterized protein (TIGR03437 family)
MKLYEHISSVLISAARGGARWRHRLAVCALLVAAAAGLARFPLRQSQAQSQSQSQAGALHGAAALDRLKRDGQYDSLQEAVRQARFSVSRAEATPLGRWAWHAPNPAAGYDAYVTEDGVSIAINDTTYVSLSLHSLGYGETLQGVATGEVNGDKQTITINRSSSLREWFVNGPDGLEHGFTLSEPPGGAGARQQGAPLRLAMQVSEGWRAVASDDGKRVTLRGAGAVVEYGKLVVRDHLGRNIPARLTVADEQVVIEVEDHDAAYPLTIDPLFTLQQKLMAVDGKAFEYFGHAVALDGNTVLIGAPYDEDSRGSAYILVRDGATWTQQARLLGQDGAVQDYFGWSVALDGDTALVGTLYGPGSANADQGAAYVFVRNGTTWTQQQKLTANDGQSFAQFGAAVALEGDTALVGAHEHHIPPSFVATGAAYVFVRNGTTWTQQAQLLANDGSGGDQFGAAVAVNSDTALVGAPGDDVGANTDQGSAYIFTRSGANWTQQPRLNNGPAEPGDHFGNAVALGGDKALIGAYLAGSDDRGAMFTFRRGATGWKQTDRTLAPNPTAGAHFGVSVAVSGDIAVVGASLGLFQQGVDHCSAYVFVYGGEWFPVRRLGPELGTADDRFGYAVALDGDTVLVGAYRADATATDQGAAYAFVLHDSRHVEQQKLTAHDGGANEKFGAAVALDGNTLVVGADSDTIGTNVEQGSVYVFMRQGMAWTLQQKLTANDGAAYDYFGSAVALSDDTLVVGAPFDNIGGNADQGSAYIFKRNGTVWAQQQKLTASGIDGLPRDNFGNAVALSGDTVLVGAAGVDNERGAAYVFTFNGTAWTQQAKLSASDGAAGDKFGYAVAISGDTLVAGALLDDIGANPNQGSAYVFTRAGTVWTQRPKLTAGDGVAGAYFGGSIAFNGYTLAVGAFRDTIGANTNQGSVYVFAHNGINWTLLQKLVASDGAANDYFGVAVVLSGGTLVVGASGDAIGTSTRQGSAYVFTGISTYWYPQQKLTASDGASDDSFGDSVAFSGDTLVVGALNDNIGANADQGSAYVFVSPSCPAIPIAPDSLPNGERGVAYNQQFTVSNDADAELHRAVSSGTLPPGLTLDDNSGRLRGTPTVTGTYRFTITVTFYLTGCSGSRDYTLTITPPCPALTLNPAQLPNGGIDTEYNIPLTAAGGAAPYSFSVTAGALPAGLSLSQAGALAGIPAASGSFTFTVKATDANGCAVTRAYTLVINGCTYTIAPASQSVSAISETGSVTVATTASCAWTAQSNNSWIKLSNFSGTGIGIVRFTVAANNGAERTGTLTIAGQTATITQAALPSGTPRLTRLTPNAARRGTNGLILTVTGSAFSASQRVQWNGANLETSFVSATELRAVIPAAEFALEGTAAVMVVDTVNGARSNLAKFRIIGAIAHASAASYNTVTLAPDSIVAAFGADLATEVRVAESLPLPTELAGTTVTVHDSQGASIRAPLFFVAPNQVNYLMPAELADGIATVTITNGRGLAIENLTEITAIAPGLFSANAAGEGAAAAVVLRIRANGEQVYEPAARYDAQTQRFVLLPIDLGNTAEQVYLILFGTGIRHREALEDVTIEIGETELPVAFAGAAPGLAGVDQVNVLLPASLRGRGEQTVVLRINDEVSNGINLHIR